MSSEKWKVTLKIYRQKIGKAPYFQDFTLEVDPEEYLLDAIERIWAFEDRSLVFAHACHHSTCGACGMRVNGVEKLSCITTIKDVTDDKATVKIEPLRNFPIISDLAVDMGVLFANMERVGHHPLVEKSKEPSQFPAPTEDTNNNDTIRLSDCIECGLCISACPVAATHPDYLGPAALAGAQQHGVNRSSTLLQLVDSAEGVWRCHSAYECTEVCPSYVEPGQKIMQLRRAVTGIRIRSLFRAKK